MNDFDFLHNNLGENSNDFQNFDDVKIPDVVLVEDDQTLGKTIKKYLEKTLNLTIHYVQGPSQCLELISTFEPDKSFCLISDISFDEGGADGLLLIDLLKERSLNFVSIVMTGFASIETAITATKKGVYHYLTKPFELHILQDLIVKAMDERFGVEKNLLFKKKTAPSSSKIQTSTLSERFKIEAPTKEDIFCGMIGRSRVMREVFERIQKVAASDSTVLINGPSGTGKELVANAIHTLSLRKNNGNVSVNCGAIPGELLESELFGHEKGSFTGAISARKGRFEIADKGTIFLDEIGDMPLLLQVKLLRVLQNRTIERVGSTTSTAIDVRIITATHRNLEQAVMDGNFREDLYYRLNVIPIKIPALSERREDIPLLISYFLSRFVSADGRNSIEFDDEALELLLTYDWPGNVRELENLMERLVILKGGSLVRASDLPKKFLAHSSKTFAYYETENFISLPEQGIDLKKMLSEIEDSLITQALEKTSGNKNRASKLLSMNRTTLIEKMKKKGIQLEI
ncbi:sigma-54-dependent transcriptional regulator [Halobacteriovorax sp. GB3]|uniref:sigma-54-dependent transcriptional regulator n=1 Tax=Halobacteriovorax sp. GB3 TaxID=2719615 RepID=UPI00235FB867|nr:sigma-54 dependent transcriptional regulator [Halobacteriovorax sp. GB3]